MARKYASKSRATDRRRARLFRIGGPARMAVAPRVHHPLADSSTGSAALTTRRHFLTQSALGAAALTSMARSFAAAKPPASPSAIDPALLKRAESLLEQAPLIDTHNDLPSMFIDLSAGD